MQPPFSIFERITTWVGSPSSFALHTLAFVAAILIGITGIADWNTVLLVLTTVVSLEAIYLSIFIQMTVNRQAAELAEVSEDVDELQEDIDEIQENVDEIQEDIDEIQEDVEEITEDDEREEKEEEERKRRQMITLETLTKDIQRVLTDLEALKERP